jgi:riboflavin kinase/FMN adenylyltransferase
MTFEPHPREFFARVRGGEPPARVANLRDKVDALADAGIARVFVQHFDPSLAALSADAFITDVLLRGCATRWLAVGDDFRFGARRTGDLALLRARAAADGYAVAVLPGLLDAGERISSSLVRTALAAGDLDRAAALLGRPYAISGHVLHGAKLGRTLGFPTLNLRIGHARPAATGIFAVRVHGLATRPWPGVASLGLRPTVDDSGRWLLETHLFGFDRQVYGTLVRVEFVRKLRDERQFDTLEALRVAIDADAIAARAVLADDLAAVP